MIYFTLNFATYGAFLLDRAVRLHLENESYYLPSYKSREKIMQSFILACEALLKKRTFNFIPSQRYCNYTK